MKSLFNKFVKSVTVPQTAQSSQHITPSNLKLARVSIHSNPSDILSCSYDPIQQILALGTSHGTIHLYGKQSVEHVLYLNERGVRITHLCFLVNRGLLCGVCERDDTNFICIWSLKSFTLKYQLNIPKHRASKDRITCLLHASPVSKFLLIGTREGTILAFNFMKRWISSHQVTPLPDKQVICMEMHPNLPTLLLTGHSEGYCATYDFATKAKEIFTLKGFFHDVTALSWHPSKEFFVASYTNGSIMVWNRKQRSVVQRIPFFEQMGVVTDVFWFKKEIVVNVNDLEEYPSVEPPADAEIPPNLDVRFDDDSTDDVSSLGDDWVDVPPSQFNENEDGEGGEVVSPKCYVPTSDPFPANAVTQIEQPSAPQVTITAESSSSDVPAAQTQQHTPPSPKTPPTSASLHQETPSSVTSQDREEFSSQISGMYKLNLTPDLTKSSSSRINKRNGSKLFLLAPNEPWKVLALPQFAGLITQDNRRFHILDLKENAFFRVGTSAGEKLRSMHVVKSTNFPSLFQSSTAPSSPAYAVRQNWPLSGGEAASFPLESSDTANTTADSPSDLVLTLGENGVVLWGMNASLGRMQRLCGLHKQKHEILSFVPWSSACLLSALQDNSLSFVYLKSMEEVIVKLPPQHYLRSTSLQNSIPEQNVSIQCLWPMQNKDIVLIGFSNGVVLGESVAEAGLCLFKAELQSSMPVTSITFSNLENMTFILVGDARGGLHVFPFTASNNSGSISPIYSVSVQEQRPLRHLIVLSKDGQLANLADQNDMPAVVSSQIANTNTKGAQIITINAHLGKKQTPLPPMFLYSESNDVKVVCPVVVKFQFKNGGISVSSGPVVFSIQGEGSVDLMWAELSSLDVMVGHMCAATGKLIKIPLPLEKGECLDGKDTVFLVHDVAQTTYRLYAGIKLLGVCKYSPSDVPPNLRVTGVNLIPREEHKEYRSTQKFLQSIMDGAQIFYNSHLSLRDMRFNSKDADIDCVFSSENFQDGPFVVACCARELKLFRLQRQTGELQHQRSTPYLGDAPIRDAQFSKFHNHNSITVLKEDGSVEIFSLHRNFSLDRIFDVSLMGADMIRTGDVPSQIAVSDDGRILAANENVFLHCALLKPNETREIQQPEMYFKRAVPKRPTTISQGIKGFLAGNSVDSSKLEQSLNQVDIDNRFLRLIDVDEEGVRHLSKEVVEEKEKVAKVRFIRGHVPQTRPEADLEQYRQELLGKHQIDGSQTPVKGDTSRMAGELDDTRALVSQARDKALERGEKLQKLEESTREMMLAAQTFAEKAEKLKQKTRGGLFG